jgi:hypothetical protein
MANSEDYTVVWAGVLRELHGNQLDQARTGLHPLIRSAKAVGLEHWFDTFATSPDGEPIFSLLIGERLDVLGYKEGRSQLSLSKDSLLERFGRIEVGLGSMGLNSRAELHVLLRIQE